MTNKRIQNDIKALMKDPPPGVFPYCEEINKLYIIICGPEDTPYEDGFFAFTIELPYVKGQLHHSYPFVPPVAGYHTQDSRTRFNPNLYRCSSGKGKKGGKVCLSILNTWHIGDPWKPIWNLSTVCLAIQSMVLVKDPLRNEPGYEKTSPSRIKNYSDIILWTSMSRGIYGMLTKPPEEFKVFLPQMNKYFLNRSDRIIERLKENAQIYDGQRISSTVYSNMKDYHPCYAGLLDKIIELKLKLLKDIPLEPEIKKEVDERTEKTEDLGDILLKLGINKREFNVIVNEMWLLDENIPKMSNTFANLRKIAEIYDINPKMVSAKTGKMIRKKKNILIEDINNKIEKLKKIKETGEIKI